MELNLPTTSKGVHIQRGSGVKQPCLCHQARFPAFAAGSHSGSQKLHGKQRGNPTAFLMARPVLALQHYRYKGCPRLATASLDSRCGRAARHNQRGSFGLEREGEFTAQQNTTSIQLAGAHLLLVKIKCRPLIINQFICKIGIIAGWGRGNTLFLKNKYLT